MRKSVCKTNEFQLSSWFYHLSFSFSFSFSNYTLPKGGPTLGLSDGWGYWKYCFGASVLVRMVSISNGSLSRSSLDLPCFPQPQHWPHVLQLLAIWLSAPPLTTWPWLLPHICARTLPLLPLCTLLVVVHQRLTIHTWASLPDQVLIKPVSLR